MAVSSSSRSFPPPSGKDIRSPLILQEANEAEKRLPRRLLSASLLRSPLGARPLNSSLRERLGGEDAVGRKRAQKFAEP